MQCYNCGFENIPGMQQCVRCQSTLMLNAVAVTPPRARGLRLRGRFSAMSHRLARWGRGFRLALPSWGVHTGTSWGVPWSHLLWSIIPGLGHWRAGRKSVARLLLIGWSALLVLALAGPPYSWWLLALAASMHVSALLSLLGPALVDWPTGRRVLLSLLLFFGLRLGVYEPIAGWAGRLYGMLPLTGFTPGSYVQNGDVLLYEGPWQRPATFQLGEIVVYRVRARQRGGVMVAEGVGLDRVVGLPGDHIRANGGVLRVNGGRASGPHLPLGALARIPDMDFKVPQGCYAILPSRLQMTVHGNPQVNLMFGELSCVPAEDVWGRVVMRVRPWSRFGRLE